MPVCEKPVALVTGSGRGIGRSIAIELGREGYAVLLNSVSANPAETESGAYEVKATIEGMGGIAEVFRGDIGSDKDRSDMVEFADTHFGRIDLLVNNAGVAPKERLDMLEASAESFDRIIGINLKGPYFLTQMVANRMIGYLRDGIIPRARISFITSISSFTSSTNRGDYCISKAGLTMAAALFADRLGEYDIPVIEVRPGVIATRMTSTVTEKYDELIDDGIFPQRRWGQPEDVARVVAAFGRGDLDYSTGTIIDVSGGFNLHRL